MTQAAVTLRPFPTDGNRHPLVYRAKFGIIQGFVIDTQSCRDQIRTNYESQESDVVGQIANLPGQVSNLPHTTQPYFSATQ
jgi:hypothetical protein